MVKPTNTNEEIRLQNEQWIQEQREQEAARVPAYECQRCGLLYWQRPNPSAGQIAPPECSLGPCPMGFARRKSAGIHERSFQMRVVLTLIAVVLAVMRIMGSTSGMFQGLAHVYVGGLFGASFVSSSRSWYGFLAWSLTLVELACFLISRFA